MLIYIHKIKNNNYNYKAKLTIILPKEKAFMPDSILAPTEPRAYDKPNNVTLKYITILRELSWNSFLKSIIFSNKNR